ncbi:MAG TPA: energy transducer TonB [Bacteroidales bacterium]|nr:energy transducer TonB [Bacteroidales bacterium]
MKTVLKNKIIRNKLDDHLLRISDYDDLIFENRNREYGAYQLRKRYNKVVSTGIIIASLLVTLIISIPFITRPDSDRIVRGGISYTTVQMDYLEPPAEQIIVPPAAPPPKAPQNQEIVKYVPPVVVDTILPSEKELAATDVVLASNTEEEVEITGAGGTGDDLLSGIGGFTDEPFFIVEVMPSFRGGDINKFRDWVQKRTNYPQEAIENRIQGRVSLTFIVEPDGSVTNVTILRGVDPLIDNEAVKAIQASPKWNPGLQRGQPVRVRYSMWLAFVF